MLLDPYIGEARVEIAFATTPDDPNPAWVDVSDSVPSQTGIQIARGRQDEYTTVSPGTCKVVLDNTDGRFTAGYQGSPYYPNVKIRRKLRVTARMISSGSGNLIDAESASFEGGTIGNWAPGGSAAPTLTNSTTHPAVGTKGMLITWATGGVLPLAALNVSGLVINRTYTFAATVWVPTGSPDVLAAVAGRATGTSTSVKNALATISRTFIASANTHTFQIWPATAPTAGQQCWVDAAIVDEGTAVPTFTTSPPVIFYRHTGYVDEWPTEWPNGGVYSIASITSIDRFKRISDRSRTLKSVVEEEYLYDSPVAYYTLGDATGSTSAGDESGQGQPNLAITQVGTGGTLTFGGGTGPGTDSLPAVQFAPANATNGKYLQAAATANGQTILTLESFFLSSVNAVQTIAGTAGLTLGVDATGHLTATALTYAAFPNNSVTVTSPGTVTNGLTRHGAVVADTTGGNLLLYLDGTQVASAALAAAPRTVTSGLTIGGANISGGTPNAFSGTLSHCALYASALDGTRIAAHSTAGSTGFAGERSDQRIARLARYGGISTAEQNLETGLSTSVAFKDITGETPLSAMQEIETTESGVLYMDGQGRLTFQARLHRYNATSAMTIGAEDVDPSLKFLENDMYLVNDVTASRPGGITFRAVNQASITDYGVTAKTISLMTTSDNEVIDAANWKANQTAVPTPRLPNLTVDLLTQHAADPVTVLGLDISSRFTINTLPIIAPSASVDLFIEGVTETISENGWTLAFNTSPASQSNVWQLDSALYSQLDSSTVLAY